MNFRPLWTDVSTSIFEVQVTSSLYYSTIFCDKILVDTVGSEKNYAHIFSDYLALLICMAN